MMRDGVSMTRTRALHVLPLRDKYSKNNGGFSNLNYFWETNQVPHSKSEDEVPNSKAQCTWESCRDIYSRSELFRVVPCHIMLIQVLSNNYEYPTSDDSDLDYSCIFLSFARWLNIDFRACIARRSCTRPLHVRLLLGKLVYSITLHRARFDNDQQR